MARTKKLTLDEKLNAKSDTFIKKIDSEMHFQSELTNDSMSFEWLDEVEFSCPYIDNIVRNPKVALITEEDVVKIEKAKKTSVASIKDLSRHTHYIERIDEKTQEVRPSKILIERREETFNTYENRFVFTLINNLLKFVERKSLALEKFESQNTKDLEYAASTTTDVERVTIKLKISAMELPRGKGENDFQKEIEEIKKRIKKVKDYISSWQRSDFVESLEKAHVAFVTSPIKKTNVILKNPNFQIAMKLWSFLQTYDLNDNETSKGGLDTSGDNTLKSILDDSFLMDYYVLDSISYLKREQKEKLSRYALVMIHQQIKRAVAILMNSGITITDEEILQIISSEIKNESNKRLVGSEDVKKKFKSMMDEYMERTQDYL